MGYLHGASENINDSEESMKKSLVVQFARFGDLLQTKRLILSLLREGEVHLCLDHSLVALAELIYPEVVLHPVHCHGQRDVLAVLSENRVVFETLQGLSFDAVYNLNFSGLNFALSTLFDPESIAGYRMEKGQRLKDPWTSMGFRWTKERRTSPLNLMDFWGLLAPSPVTPQEVNPIARRKGGGIGVVLAGRQSRRSLPPEVLVKCIESVFTAHGGTQITLLGTKAEVPLARKLVRLFTPPMLARLNDLSGRTSFHELVEVVDGLDVLLTPDTGSMHLAAHLGTPVHAFFLSSAWAVETGPYGLGHRIWQGMLPCSPCLESAPCPIGVECLNAFKDERFYCFLAGKIDDNPPDNMLGLVSMLDAVGVVYMPVFGEDPRAPERKDKRGVLAEYLGLIDIAPIQNNAAAEMLYQEADWALGSRNVESGFSALCCDGDKKDG